LLSNSFTGWYPTVVASCVAELLLIITIIHHHHHHHHCISFAPDMPLGVNTSNTGGAGVVQAKAREGHLLHGSMAGASCALLSAFSWHIGNPMRSATVIDAEICLPL
jgi:hypothetical protein